MRTQGRRQTLFLAIMPANCMEDEFVGRAAEMLLQGATLVGEPCPYCKSGVRVIKDGDALCVSCGKAGQKGEAAEGRPDPDKQPSAVLGILERKMEALAKELESETDHQRQQEIIKVINSIDDAIGKIGGTGRQARR